jgi:hypothetical protein
VSLGVLIGATFKAAMTIIGINRVLQNTEMLAKELKLP